MEALRKRMGDAPPYKIVQGRRRFEDGLNSGYYGAQIAYGKIEFARTAPNMTSRRKQQVPLPLRAPYYLRRYTHTVGRQRESTPNGPTSPVKSVADITIGKGMNVSRTHATIDLNKEGTGFQIMVSGKNGALVNSEFVEKDADPLPLSHGSKVSVGDVEMTLILTNDDERKGKKK